MAAFPVCTGNRGTEQKEIRVLMRLFVGALTLQELWTESKTNVQEPKKHSLFVMSLRPRYPWEILLQT